MPLYVGLYKFTDQGRKTIKDSPKRARDAIAANEKAGIKIHHLLYTTGRYDLISVLDAPNEQAALASGFAILAQGNVVGEVLHAYSIEEIEKVVSRLP
jgi:uncharacterized protein with GYD domain